MPKITALLSILFLIAISGLFAQTTVPAVPSLSLHPFANQTKGSDGAQFQNPLTTMADGAFRTAGFLVVPSADQEGAKRSDYVLEGFFVLENDRLVFQASVTHRDSGRVIASDMASIYAGLTSLELIDEVLAGIAQKTAAFSKHLAATRRSAVPLPESLIFKSLDEGASVSWGGGGPIGLIAGGQVEAPYFPFPSDGNLVVTVEKEGYIPRTTIFALSVDSRIIVLPPLTKEVTRELAFSTGLGRLFGAGVAYRHYLIPNQVYLVAEDCLYFHSSLAPGSHAVPHNDLWLMAGAYLFFPPESDFRISVQAGVGGLFTLLGDTPKLFTDFLLVPINLVFEYRGLFGIPLYAEFRLPYALGLGDNLIGQKWVMVQDMVPIINVGVLWRF